MVIHRELGLIERADRHGRRRSGVSDLPQVSGARVVRTQGLKVWLLRRRWI